MKLLYTIGLLLLFCTLCVAQKNAKDFYKFTDCHASSTYSTGGGVSEFDARRALQPGRGYWSSRGGHSSNEEVTWTGTLPAAAHMEGIKIRWACAPLEVQVSVSPDGESFHVAAPYRRTPSNDVSFDEDIYFDHPESAKAVMISMRNAIHDYFCINEVNIIGGGEPLIMVISGITYPSMGGDMCLQVEEGKFNQEGAEIVLEPCAMALAAGDGRELWRQNDNEQLQSARSKPAKCATLYGGNTEGGGKIVLTDCMRALEEADGRSNWVFEANSQLRLQKPGSYCLSQKNVNGNAAGLGDVIRTLGGAAKSSSSADSSHGAEKAVDNSLETYWASGGFEDDGEHLVNIDIDLGKEVKLARMRVDWEYPALSYIISTSKDGQTFAEQCKNEANPSNSTLDSLGGASAQHVRISMMRPHPQYGKSGDKYLYGIRQISVLANRLQSIVADCREAANSDDARDKYFVEYTTEFDELLAEKLASMDEDVLSRTKQINEIAKELEDLFPQMDACLNDKKHYDERMKKLTETSSSVAEQLNEVTQAEAHPVTQLSPGDSPQLPAEDCSVIKNTDVNATSGFYWIEPKCASEPLRMYCDMESGSSFYVWNGSPPRKPGTLITDKVNSVEDVRLHCAELGLEPVILRSMNQLKSLESALQQMGYRLDGKGAIPLGFDYGCGEGHCTGRYGDLLDGVTDVTAVLMSKSIPEVGRPSSSNSIGFGLSGAATSSFDIGSSEIMAIVCSTNTFEGESEMSHLDITCETTAADNDAFNGLANTNIVVECPPGCEESCSDVFGSGGVYAAKSRICCAAIHAGLIQKGGMVNVALESGRDSYDGSRQNGIESKALTRGYHRSIRLGPIAKDCPIETFELQPSSFLEASSTSSVAEALGTQETPGEKKEDIPLDPAMAGVIENLLSLIDEIHGVDPNIVVAAMEDAANVIGKTRKHLKPAEKLQQRQTTQALQLFMSTEDLANTLYDTSGSYYTTLEQLNSRLEELAAIRASEQGFASFKFDYAATTFAEAFEVHDSVRAKGGPSNWGFSDSPVGGRPNTIGQTSEITGQGPGEGTYAMLRHHQFFDTVTTVDFFAQGSGSVGIAFRMRNVNNMFLLEFNQKEGVTRIYKISDGEVTLIYEVPNGGYLESKWFHVRIETSQGKTTICANEAGQKSVELFNFLDESFLSGTVGLFSSGVKNGVFFDSINVKAKSCTKISKKAPPHAPRCSHFKETYFGSIQYLYEKNDHNAASPGAWEFKENVGGRKKVIAQLNAVNGHNSIGTNLILKRHRLCKDGYMSFDFFPECSNGGVGAIFRYESPQSYYVVEVFPTEMKIRSIQGNTAKTLAKSEAFVSLNKWHNLNINFEGPSVWATLKGPDGRIFTVNAEDIGRPSYDGQVGITAFNCAGVAYDNFQVSPFKIEQNEEADSVVAHEKKPWHACIETVHLLQRRDMCHSMLHQEPQYRQVSCAQNFCSECCRYHTSLLKPAEQSTCVKSCRLNEDLAQRIESQFLDNLSNCLKGKGPAFDHCSENDTSCQLEACHFCCTSSEGVRDMGDIPEDLVQGSAEREISECKYQCGSKFAIVQ